MNPAHGLAVLAKRPLPGRVKTRLSPPFSPQQAASLAGAALHDTLAAVSAADVTHRLLVFDGDPTDWRPAGWEHVVQASGGLDRRIAAALKAGERPTVVVGMDTPQLTPEQLAEPDLERFDACLGPASDGGYWAIGLARPELAASAVHRVPMSMPDTGERQLHRLRALGLRVQLLAELTDVDTAEAAATVAAAAPHTRFARQLRAFLDENRDGHAVAAPAVAC